MSRFFGSWWLFSPSTFASELARLLGLALMCLSVAGCDASGGALRFEVASSSMVPALFGPTRLATCKHCGQRRAIAAETYNAQLPTRCASCGGLCTVDTLLLAGDEIELRPLQEATSIQRFDLVAITGPKASLPQVKRVWGLPGEQLEFRDGDLWLNGELFQKTLTQLKQVSVPVANFPRDVSSHWMVQTNKGLIAIEELAGPDKEQTGVLVAAGQELLWKHRRPARVHPAEVDEAQWLKLQPILDDYAANQGVRCELHACQDYLFSLRLQERLQGSLRIDCEYQQRIIPLVVRGSREPAVSSQASADHGDWIVEARARVDLALCDGRLICSTDVESCSINAADASRGVASTMNGEASSTAVLRLVSDSETRIRQLAIARDLYLYQVESGSAELGRGSTEGFFVMGDNLPVSIDSRSSLGRIPRSRIMGLVDLSFRSGR
jgi:hypothetical protein